MKQPSEEQINIVESLFSKAIQRLIEEDLDNLMKELEAPIILSEEHKKLDRKLHEITINHRLAVYIEAIINAEFPDYRKYKVDIEYNRFYHNHKEVLTEEGPKEARPDILVHTRTEKDINQHFLAVECKKENISKNDLLKIKGLISDENYNYLFGATVSYNRRNQK